MSNRRSLHSEERRSSVLIKSSSLERLHLEQLSIVQLSNLIERLNMDLTDLQFALDIKDKILIEQLSQFDSLSESNKALLEKNRNLEKAIEKNNASIQEMQTKSEHYIDRFEMCGNQLTSKDALIGVLQSKNYLLEAQVKDLTKIIETPDDDLSPIDKIYLCEIKNKVFSRNYDPLLELETTKNMYIEDIQALSFNNAFLRNKISDLDDRIYMLEDQVAYYKIQANNSSSEISNLTDKLQSLQDEFSSEVKKLKEEILHKDSELKKSKDLVSEYVKSLKVNKQKIKRLMQVNKDLENMQKENNPHTEVEKITTKALESQKINEGLDFQKINEDLHSQKINEDLHSQKINEDLHSQKINEDLHSQKINEDLHSQKINEDLHSQKINEDEDNVEVNSKKLCHNSAIRTKTQTVSKKNSCKENTNFINALRDKVIYVYRELFCKINITSRDYFQISGNHLADIECNFNKLVEFITENMEEKLDSLETSACSKLIYI